MIYTLTLNPAVDYFLHVNNLIEGDLNLSTHTNILVGGKGINVSFVLSNLQIKTTAFGFIGGFVGNIVLKELKAKDINTDFISVNTNTRINIKLYNNSTKKETEIAGSPPLISKEQEKELITKISQNLKDGDILVLSGSIPSVMAKNIYKIIAQQVSSNVKVVLDTRGSSLKDNLHNNFLIKPNKKEIEEMFNKKLNSDKDIIDACGYFFENGVKNVIVSMGAEGSLYANKNHVYRAQPIKLDVKNSVGAGDSMVAGFVYGMIQNESLENCYRLAVATSCSTITSDTLATKAGIEDFYKQIIIQQIK